MNMYQITLYGKALGQPMPLEEATAKVERLRFVVKGLEIRRVKGA